MKNNYANQIRKTIELEKHWAHQYSRQQTLDLVTITLGEMGMSPEELYEFAQNFLKIEDKFITNAHEDLQADNTIEYTRYDLDRSLQQYVLPDKFVPMEERYNF